VIAASIWVFRACKLAMDIFLRAMAVLSPCRDYNFESPEILPHSALDKKALMPEANWPKIMLFRRSFDAMELSTTRTFHAGEEADSGE
jgi:hypothetical protein